MARHLRVDYSGAIYHVSCRMVGEGRWVSGSGEAGWGRLFRDDKDRERFLHQLADRVKQCQIRLYLFVCMANHFHLVFETPQANCSKFMQTLLTAYTVYYNLRHGRHGHLFDGRYKAKVVEGDSYLLALSRYVHLNPVQIGGLKDKPIAERVEALRAYAWSSYPGYIGKHKALEFVDYGPLLGQMQGGERDRPKCYREFVEMGLAESDDDFKAVLKQSPRCIGGQGFRVWIDELYEQRLANHARPEDVSFRHRAEPLPVSEVMGCLAEVFGVGTAEFYRRGRGAPWRAVAARCLLRYAGMSQRDVADHLGMGSGAAVCNQLTRLTGKLADSSQLRREVKQVEDRLDEIKSKRKVGGS